MAATTVRLPNPSATEDRRTCQKTAQNVLLLGNIAYVIAVERDMMEVIINANNLLSRSRITLHDFFALVIAHMSSETLKADCILLHAPSVFDFRDRDDVFFAFLSESDSVNVTVTLALSTSLTTISVRFSAVSSV